MHKHTNKKIFPHVNTYLEVSVISENINKQADKMTWTVYDS